MALQDFSIRARLIGLILFGLLALGAAIGYSLFNTSNMRDDIVRMAQREYPMIASAHTIREAVQQNWINTLYLTQITDSGTIASLTATMEKNSAAITREFDYLKRMATSREEADLLLQALAARQAYTVVRKDYVALVKSGSADAASGMVISQLQPRLDAYLQSLEALTTLNGKRFDETSSHAETSVTRGFQLNIALGVVTLLVGLWLSREILGSIVPPLARAVSLAHEIARGNLRNTIAARPHSRDEVNHLLAALDQMQSQLHGTAGTMQRNAHELAEAAQALTASTSEVAQGSTVQSESAASMAAAVEEMTVSIQQLSEHAGEARAKVDHSAALSLQNSDAIRQTLEEMQQISASVTEFAEQLTELEEQSQQISAVVDVIKELAEQTNLLALNAAIEAARAGEQGRGFAVVADEVRKLAERTTQSTQEISGTIGNIQAHTGKTVARIQGAVERVANGMEYARNAGAAAEELHSEAEQVNRTVAEISHALREQSQASEQIAANVERIAQMTERTNVAVGQMSGAAGRLQQLAVTLDESTHRFSL
jgi:methyl-accepting chemotaxis protein